MNSGYIHVQTVSGYFDSNDYEEPIKTYLNQNDFFPLNSSSYQGYEIDIQENEALVSDNLFFSTGQKSLKYYAISDPIYKSYSNSQNPLLLTHISMSLDKESERYERVVYTFFDMFGYLGGLFDFLYFVGYIFVGYFNNRHYMHKLLSKLYQIEKSQDSHDLINDKTLEKSIHPKTKLPNKIDFHSKNSQNFGKSFDIFKSSYDSQTSFRHNDILNCLNRSLINRRMYSYG